MLQLEIPTEPLVVDGSASARRREDPPQRRPASFPQWPIMLALMVYSSFALWKLGQPELGIDEGRFGVSAINLFSDHLQWAIVSEDPLGGPGTKPFGYPVLLGATVRMIGKTEFALRIVNVVLLAVAALLLHKFVEIVLQNSLAAFLAFGLFLLNPGTLTYARTAMPEPLVVAAGCLGLFCAAKFVRGRSLAWAVACGFALGVGFLSKLWLVLPFVLACFSILALRFLAQRDRVFLAGTILAFLLFLLVAGSHLVLVLWMTPQSWRHWANIYFFFSFGSRIAGGGYDPVMWYRPWWFYLAAVLKASFFGLPLLFLGALALRKRVHLPTAVVLLSLLSPVFVFSLFRVKQASYIYPAYPALALLLALGWIYFIKDARQGELLLASLLSVGGAAIFFAEGVFGVREFAALAGLYLLYFAVALAGSRFNLLGRYGIAAALLAALVFADALVVKQSLQPPTYYREIAEYFRPQLLVKRPQEVAFTAPAYPAMEFYTFRSGEYWETFYVKKSVAEVAEVLRRGERAFYLVDPSQTMYGGKISPGKLQALRDGGVDATEQVERALGHAIPLRVYVPRVAR